MPKSTEIRFFDLFYDIAELELDETGEGLLKRVDTALYQAKEGGRNRVITAASTAQT